MTIAARLVNVPPEPNSMCGTKTGFLRVLAQVAVDAVDSSSSKPSADAVSAYTSLRRTAPNCVV